MFPIKVADLPEILSGEWRAVNESANPQKTGSDYVNASGLQVDLLGDSPNVFAADAPHRREHKASVIDQAVHVLSSGESYVNHVTIDSRKAGANSLFVPLSGEHVDGHDFIPKAVEQGASAYLCRPEQSLGLPGEIIVQDPMHALTMLGAWVRYQVNPIVVGITGSNGKTSTKDMLYAMVASTRPTVATYQSFNNEIGLPLTLCSLEAQTEVCISEIGSRGVGQIAQAMWQMRPDIAIITSIASAHLSEFGSIEQVIAAKGELIAALPTYGTAVLSADSQHSEALSPLTNAHVLTCGFRGANDLRPDFSWTNPSGQESFVLEGTEFTPPLAGKHQASNALLALGAARTIGISFAQASKGLSRAVMSPGRMETQIVQDILLVNDAYNANVTSAIAGLETFGNLSVRGKRYGVFGKMLELGQEEISGHIAVAEKAVGVGITEILTFGDGAALYKAGSSTVRTFPSLEAITSYLQEQLVTGDAVYAKGSSATQVHTLLPKLADFLSAPKESA